MRAHDPIRRGFTLVELLIVIAIITVLAAFMIPMVSGALNSQRKGKATGEIAALMGACERYRKLYGDFPCASGAGDPTLYRRDLYKQLTGQQRLRSTTLADGSLALDLMTPTTVRPILNPGMVTAANGSGDTPSDLSTCVEFIDPWGNVYDYRYRILNGAATSTTASPYNDWRSPDCLIVSCGVKFVPSINAATPQVPLPEEYWDLETTMDMRKRGTIPPTYYEDSAGGAATYYRADNVTSFSGR